MFRKEPGYVSKLFNLLAAKSGELIAPRQSTCNFCGKHTKESSGAFKLCRSCFEQIPWIRDVLCPVCGRYEKCYDCGRRTETYFTCSRSAVRYDPGMKDWLARYKYRGDERLNSLFVDMLSQAYEQLMYEQEQIMKAAHYITYVPLSHERLQERGFNQAEQLALGLGRKYKAPVVSLLHRTRHTDKQSYKTRAERLNDLHGIFALDKQGLQSLRERNRSVPGSIHVIVIDDVYTTGSTLNECAKVISAEMDASVYGLTWAR